jgi:hypothetical protein
LVTPRNLQQKLDQEELKLLPLKVLKQKRTLIKKQC